MKQAVRYSVPAVVTAFVLAGCGVTTTGTSTSSTRASSPAAPTTTPATASTVPTLPSVPVGYKSTYNVLQTQLPVFSALSSSSGATTPGSTVISSALEPADGNVMRPGILQTNSLDSSTTMLHRMKAIGETGVTIQVSFPLLVSSFPDSSEYTTYYQDIAQVVHQEGMTLTVEENPLFGNISTLPISSYYAGLSLQSYGVADHQMAQTIINALHPAYLSILTEPDTYTAVIHNPGVDLNSVARGLQFVNTVMSGLQKDGTMVGAGTGTWTDPSYDQMLLAQTAIDYIDMHVYPIAQVDLNNMIRQVAAAVATHKPLIMSECWLYKEGTDGSPLDGPQAAPTEQKVGTYSFWEPLDEQFLTAVVRYARASKFLVVSPFSTLNFFAYQTFTPALDAQTSTEVRSSFDHLVSAALVSGQLSAVGQAYRRLAA